MRKQGSCLEKEIMQGQKEQCQVHAGEEDHAWPGWTTSKRGQDCPWKSQSEWQRTEINGESTSMVWPTLGLRTAKEQNSGWTGGQNSITDSTGLHQERHLATNFHHHSRSGWQVDNMASDENWPWNQGALCSCMSLRDLNVTWSQWMKCQQANGELQVQSRHQCRTNTSAVHTCTFHR